MCSPTHATPAVSGATAAAGYERDGAHRFPVTRQAGGASTAQWSHQDLPDSMLAPSNRILTTSREEGLMFRVGGRRQASRKGSGARPTTSRSTAALRMACLAAALSPALVAAFAPAAEGSTYAVWACANGSGLPLSAGSWVRTADATLTDLQTTCREPAAAVGAFLARARAASADPPGGGGWVVAAAHGTRIAALDVWWSWQSAPGGAIRVYAMGNTFLDPKGATDPFDGRGRCCSDSAFVNLKAGAFGALTMSNPSIALGRANHQSFPRLRALDGRGVPILGLAAMCVTGCTSGNPVAQFQAYRVKTTVEDPTPPTGTATGLRDGLRVGSATSVDATASDGGGGIRELTLRIDGNPVQRISGGDGCSDVDSSNADPLEYNLMKPCPSTLTGPLTLGAAHLPDNGPHVVTVVATDAAGQNTILSSGRVALEAPHGFYDPNNGFYNPDLSVIDDRKTNGSRADQGARLTLAFVRGRRTVRGQTVRYSTRPRVRGRLRTASKKPIAGARVWLASRISGSQWQLARKPLITSRAGVASARLPARTPSRRVRLVYFPFADRNDHAKSPSRDLRVRATTTIHSDQGGYRNGDTLTFTGQVLKKRLIDNKSVYLQAMVRGKWRTFATTQADSSGRWQMTHRFEATRRATRYTFRAVVPAQTGYHWATGHSRSVRVLVTP